MGFESSWMVYVVVLAVVSDDCVSCIAVVYESRVVCRCGCLMIEND